MESFMASAGESSAQHPSLFNPAQATSNLTFHLFPNLPKEIRDMIWVESLICERYIAIELWGKNQPHSKFYRQELLTYPPPAKPEYKLVLMNPPRPNALFGTNTESRANACRFYRVHLPCYSVKGSQIHAPGMFRFNPELDTLEIHGLEHFTTFANDLWRHDREKKGLRNVSFKIKNSLSFYRFYKPGASSDQLHQAVGRLEHVTFIHYTWDRVDLAFGISHQFPLMYSRSLPVAGGTGSFSRQRDPRPLEIDVLNSVSLETFPKNRVAMVWMNWSKQLRAGRPCVFRFAYAAEGRQRPSITDRASAMAFLKDEVERWQEFRLEDTVPEQFDSQLQTAFGFWSFPLEPQGLFSKGYPRPELCVFHL
ncbi:hypothetical protein FCIRC_7549 [Fusarium circinatum]|uniref:2EXR domain-containing protein n=1 Tax=Fusarium circinatum TaxID=48490 RepID=A0A8H5WWW9_FUSCI|nr:hypothetical protein FCIRC_7549 [Fusarium circinatum]